jgi:quercetin dioxygenase-like cupin family protein
LNLGIASLVVALTQSTPQANAPGFLIWSYSELERRSEALGTRITRAGSGRETLADYVTPVGSHRFRFIRREGDRRPEQHDAIDDVVYIQSGSATVLVGGEMLGRTGDLGTEILGGTQYSVARGDVLRIPAGTPHQYSASDGEHITYVLVRLPAFVGEPVADPDGEAPRLEPPGFALWPSSELAARDAALTSRVGPDDSARETLADYGAGGLSHRFRFIRREGEGWPELHEDIIDVVFVQSGHGTLLVGGEMIGQSNAPGSSIRGGVRHTIAAGDVLHIPAGVPHAYLVPEGEHITYLLVRVPAVES